MDEGKDTYVVHPLSLSVHDTADGVLFRPSPPVATMRQTALVGSLSEFRYEGVVSHDEVADSCTIVLSEDSINVRLGGLDSHEAVVHEEKVLVSA